MKKIFLLVSLASLMFSSNFDVCVKRVVKDDISYEYTCSAESLYVAEVRNKVDVNLVSLNQSCSCDNKGNIKLYSEEK